MALDLKKLEDNGVGITYETNWVGDGDDRHQETDYDRVTSVFFNLSADEWCHLASREGEYYIGGCCGTSSAIQDIINGVFRDGCSINGNEMYELGELAKSHPDGFKEWGFLGNMSEKEFAKRCADWADLDPWEKIGLCYQAVKGKIRPYYSEPIVQKGRADLDEKREIDELYGCIHALHFASVFKSIEKMPGINDKDNGQEHGNDVLTLAKMLPGARRLVKQLEANFTTWSGIAIVEKDRPEVITHNGFGLCIYNTEEDAREVMSFWTRNNRDGEKTVDHVRLRPVTISVQNGVVFND
jgi:hypothetical protein